MSCGVGCRCGSDPVLLLLWPRPGAAGPIEPQAWELPYAMRASQEMAKRRKKFLKKDLKDVCSSVPGTQHYCFITVS